MTSAHHLVVGINGNIGAALYERLQTQGASVWGTTQRPESAKQANVCYVNLLDPPSAWSLPSVKFDTVYVCAGICRMALCENDPEGTGKVNIDGMQALIRHFAEQGAFIVYLSTNQVFSGEAEFVSEAAPYAPLNEYGRQKAVVEAWLQAHYPRHAIVRLTKVVEPGMSLIQTWIDQLTQHQPVEAFHDMVLAPVSRRQVIDVLVHIGQQQQAGCYHVSGDRDVSYLEAAQFLATQLNLPLSLVHSVSAIDKGIKKTFLPRFTTLVCSSTIALCGVHPPAFAEVVHECFKLSGTADLERSI